MYENLSGVIDNLVVALFVLSLFSVCLFWISMNLLKRVEACESVESSVLEEIRAVNEILVRAKEGGVDIQIKMMEDLAKEMKDPKVRKKLKKAQEDLGEAIERESWKDGNVDDDDYDEF